MDARINNLLTRRHTGSIRGLDLMGTHTKRKRERERRAEHREKEEMERQRGEREKIKLFNYTANTIFLSLTRDFTVWSMFGRSS